MTLRSLAVPALLLLGFVAVIGGVILEIQALTGTGTAMLFADTTVNWIVERKRWRREA